MSGRGSWEGPAPTDFNYRSPWLSGMSLDGSGVSVVAQAIVPCCQRLPGQLVLKSMDIRAGFSFWKLLSKYL